MMQAWWMFCICSLIFVIVSLFTPPPAEENLKGLTWSNPLAVIFGPPLRKASDPRIVAALLLLAMIVLYYIFR
jgi:SSS family solute:Na+ symporter